ncbi:uncharacterized protein EV420DRAFT_1576711 [Desarmillaria tabescens]|uniref:Uncharacterized protein n=1 Tax=Armillaria tabescens TaxID=1929756 RepID=A0AA39JIQ8_ARMTA|nr:uncharacterized protein EV420DRAFT_1576711 [Desarmillaria tabescens]KAK0443393.1 hypothetical protein EV420DRAFT_1576711 [Desarmillaria tabescens]
MVRSPNANKSHKSLRLPSVTLSPLSGTGQMATIPVLKQQSYTGKKPIIPDTLADMLCADLGIQGLLERLNTTLGTSYTPFTACVCSIFEDYIAKNYDFGTAYAHLHPFWYDLNDLATMVLRLFFSFSFLSFLFFSFL